MSKVNWKKWLQWLLGIAGLGVAVWYFAWRSPPELWTEGLRVNPVWLLLGFLIYFLFIALSTVRWAMLLTHDLRSLPFRELFLLTAMSKGFGSITPMNAGEFLKAELSHKLMETGRNTQYGIVAVERLLDVSMLMVFAVTGIMFQPRLHENFANRLPQLTLFLILGLAVVIGSGYLAYRFVPKVRNLLQSMRGTGKVILQRPQVILMTLAQWFVIALLWVVIAVGFHVSIGWLDTLLLVSLTTFITVGSLLPGGLGLADIGVTEIGVMLGYLPREGLMLMLVVRSNTLISLLIGVGCWMWRRYAKTNKPIS